MGKKLVIIGFVLSLVLAVYIFATHETRSLKESINKASAREPRAVLEDFVAYRYEGDTLKARLNAHLAEFFEPNVVVLEGEVSGERRTEGGEREEIGAESASAYFKPSSLTKMLDPTQANELERAELTGFVEVVIAPMFTKEALEVFSTKKNVRLLQVEGVERRRDPYTEYRSVVGGLLTQDGNIILHDLKFNVVTKRAPTDEEIKAMKYAWKVAKYVKSNATVFARPDRAVAIGAG